MMEAKKVLLDIGANCGLYSLANRGNYGQFILVEANQNLQHKLKAVDLPNKEIVMKIVSNEANPVFYVSEQDTISTCNKKWVNDCRFSGEYSWAVSTDKTASITLDKLVDKYQPTFIKIDVEGYELNVIKSLTRKACPMCFEWSEELKEELIETIQYLEGLGYCQFSLCLEDNYTYMPQESQYHSGERAVEIIESSFKSGRKALWGMCFSK